MEVVFILVAMNFIVVWTFDSIFSAEIESVNMIRVMSNVSPELSAK